MDTAWARHGMYELGFTALYKRPGAAKCLIPREMSCGR